MKSKGLLVLVVFIMIVVLFVGCGENVNITEPSTTEQTQSTTVETYSDIEDYETDPAIPDSATLTFPEYNAMSAEEQHKFVSSFENTEDFFAWYEEKKQKYEEYLANQLNPTESTNPEVPTEDPTNDSTESTTPKNEDVPSAGTFGYLEYQSMSADQQLNFINNFETIDAFFDWYNAAKQEYQDSQIEIEGTGPIDLEEIIG